MTVKYRINLSLEQLLFFSWRLVARFRRPIAILTLYMQQPFHGLQNNGDVRGDGIQWARDDHLEYPGCYRDEKTKSGAIGDIDLPTPCAAPKYNLWCHDHINGAHVGGATPGGRVASAPILPRSMTSSTTFLNVSNEIRALMSPTSGASEYISGVTFDRKNKRA